MQNTHLSQAFSKLNQAQQEAIEWGEGPILVLAGPGSGKTQVLTCRIARLLEETKDEKFRILGLTFTNKAADEMRSRVTQLVPGQEPRLFLGTFHSFCAEILRQHGSHLGIQPNFEIYSQAPDLEAILNDAVEKAKVDSPFVSDFDKKTLPVIHNLKSRLIFPEDCKNAFRDPEFGERMAVVYPAYEKELTERNVLDFTSLILRSYQLLIRFPAFGRRYRLVYPWVCVDEFQDTNHAQYHFLRAILGDGSPNLFVVADDDQIIYQWNGASHQRIQELTDNYSPQVIQLPVNYRCPPEIVGLANKLIQHNFLRTVGKKPLISGRGTGGSGTVRLLAPFDDYDAETAGIARDILQLHSKHPNQVAVIARTRTLLLGVERSLRLEGISATIAQRKDEFESPPIVWIHSMLRLSNDRQNQRFLAAVVGSFGQLTGAAIDENEVASQADASNHDYLRRWIMLAQTNAKDPKVKDVLSMASRELGEGRDFMAFTAHALNWYSEWTKQQESGHSAEETFALFGEEKDVWNGLQNDIRATLGEECTLEAFLQELQMRSKESPPGPNILPLYTIHASKGKEFDHVYLVGLVDDELPSFQSKKKGDKSPEMEEERRNCFVAITRASETLTLSYAKKYRGWLKEPSRFLFEMGLLVREKKPSSS